MAGLSMSRGVHELHHSRILVVMPCVAFWRPIETCSRVGCPLVTTPASRWIDRYVTHVGVLHARKVREAIIVEWYPGYRMRPTR